MRIYKFFFTILFFALSNFSYAKTSKPIQFDTEWIAKDGERHKPEMDIFWMSWHPFNEKYDFLREPSLNAKTSNLNKGPFPLPYPKQANIRHEAFVTIALALDAEGNANDCSVIEPSDYVSVNAHVCPHILKYAQFYPSLDNEGKRLPIRGIFLVLYNSHTKKGNIITVPSPSGFDNIKESKPKQRITWQSLGIDKVRQVPAAAQLAIDINIDEKGKPTHCRLSGGTYIDTIDIQICKAAMSLEYEPAIDHEGTPIASNVIVGLEF